jgi:hypothetical protein
MTIGTKYRLFIRRPLSSICCIFCYMYAMYSMYQEMVVDILRQKLSMPLCKLKCFLKAVTFHFNSCCCFSALSVFHFIFTAVPLDGRLKKLLPPLLCMLNSINCKIKLELSVAMGGEEQSATCALSPAKPNQRPGPIAGIQPAGTHGGRRVANRYVRVYACMNV